MNPNVTSGLRKALLTTVLIVPVMSAQAAGFAVVTNGNDAGAGSLRHALEVQQANIVVIKPWVNVIDIDSTLEYTGDNSLAILGSGQTVRTANNVTLLAVTQGADLTVSNLSFEGPGNFDINNRGDLSGPAGKGIFVDVRDDQTGQINVVLHKVSVARVANHGIHVSDCSLADDCGGGSGGGGEGSPASINLVCNYCTVNDAGNGKFDADGIRVDDRGDGSIYFLAKNSTFVNVGADGVELDEGNEGSVIATAINTHFTDNGGYCNPAILEAFLPAEPEGEFDESEQVTDADVPGPDFGSPDDSCLERSVDFYDSGFVEEYEIAIDVDDGIDLDEAGPGSLVSALRDSTITGNFDDVVDYDEEDAGDIIVSFVRSSASGNTDDGFKMSEEDEGGVFGQVRGSSSNDNGGKGFVFEEEDEGDLAVNLVRTRTANNDDSDNTGVEAVQEDEGSGTLRVRSSDIADGIDTDGVDEI